MRHFYSLNQDVIGPTREDARINFSKLILEILKQAVFAMQGPHVLPPPLDTRYKPLVVQLYEEPSTRTATSNEIAAMRMGCDVINITASASSIVKNESLLDMVDTLGGYGIFALVVRTKTKGVAKHLKEQLQSLEGPENWIHKGACIMSGGEGPLTHAQQWTSDCACFFLEDGFRKHGGPSINRLDQWKDLDEALRHYSDKVMIEMICQFMDELQVCFDGDSAHSRIVSSAFHTAQYFDSHYLLVGPQQLMSDLGSVSINAEPSTNFEDAKAWPRIYVLRTQLERLTGPAEARSMSERDAVEVISPFQITEGFAGGYDGKIYHARPRDSKNPMIPLNMKSQVKYPNLRFLMQSSVGEIGRRAFFFTLYAGRFEDSSTIPIPSLSHGEICLIKNSEWQEHQDELARKYAGQEPSDYVIHRGFTGDRFRDGSLEAHQRLFTDQGVYNQPGVEKHRALGSLWSEKRGVYKCSFTFWGGQISHIDAAVHGLISPEARFSIMDEAAGDHGYERREYPLPNYVGGFSCLDDDCFTRRESTAECIHRVHGKKGDVDEQGRSNSTMECTTCEHREPAWAVIQHQYPGQVRPDKVRVES